MQELPISYFHDIVILERVVF